MSWRWRSIREGVGLFLLPGLPIIVTFNDCVGGLARIHGLSMAPSLNRGTATASVHGTVSLSCTSMSTRSHISRCKPQHGDDGYCMHCRRGWRNCDCGEADYQVAVAAEPSTRRRGPAQVTSRRLQLSSVILGMFEAALTCNYE